MTGDARKKLSPLACSTLSPRGNHNAIPRLLCLLAVAIGFAAPAASQALEQVSATTLTVEAKIPFEVTRNLKLYHDSMIVAGLGSVWSLSTPNSGASMSLTIPLSRYRFPASWVRSGGGAFGEDAILDRRHRHQCHFQDQRRDQQRRCHRARAQMLSRDSTIALGAGSLWVVTAENSESTLTRFDAATGNVEATIELPAPSGGGVIYAFDAAWVIGTTKGEVYRVDPAKNAITGTTKIHGCRMSHSRATARSGSIAARMRSSTGSIRRRVKLSRASRRGCRVPKHCLKVAVISGS